MTFVPAPDQNKIREIQGYFLELIGLKISDALGYYFQLQGKWDYIQKWERENEQNLQIRRRNEPHAKVDLKTPPDGE